MFCTKCGHEVAEGATICENCGNTLEYEKEVTEERVAAQEEAIIEAPASEETVEEATALDQTIEEATALDETVEEATASEEIISDAKSLDEIIAEAPVLETNFDYHKIEEIDNAETVDSSEADASKVEAETVNFADSKGDKDENYNYSGKNLAGLGNTSSSSNGGAQAPVGDNSKNKIAAGLFAIFLGAFGAHKFYLGYTTEGVIMLLTTIFGSLLCGLGPMAMGIVAIVEGILYLTKTDDDFYSTYVANRKTWF